MQPDIAPLEPRTRAFGISPISITDPSTAEPCSPPNSSSSTATVASGGSDTASPSRSIQATCRSSQQWKVGSAVSTPAHCSTSNEASAQPTIHSQGASSGWLYRLVTFPSYFTPCVYCCGGSRTPKREQLMTQFDTQYPFKVYCSHCPGCKDRSATLLQVRRSAFKDVVKVADIQHFGADVAGVQQYTLNGSKVIYLNREQTPDKKNSSVSTAPAQCSVDGRAMMDKSSQYCSLKCKTHAEDPHFNSWLDQQDPSVRCASLAMPRAGHTKFFLCHISQQIQGCCCCCKPVRQGISVCTCFCYLKMWHIRIVCSGCALAARP